jgi:hypothetical protein
VTFNQIPSLEGPYSAGASHHLSPLRFMKIMPLRTSRSSTRARCPTKPEHRRQRESCPRPSPHPPASRNSRPVLATARCSSPICQIVIWIQCGTVQVTCADGQDRSRGCITPAVVSPVVSVPVPCASVCFSQSKTGKIEWAYPKICKMGNASSSQ